MMFRGQWPEQTPENRLSEAARVRLARVAIEKYRHNGSAESLTSEVKEWASSELDGRDGVLRRWRRYGSALKVSIPRSVDELLQVQPNLAPTFMRLHYAKQELTRSREVTIDGKKGKNVGETMHLAVLPWQAMSGNLYDFDEWVKAVRKIQGRGEPDYIEDHLLQAIQIDKRLYCSPDNPMRLLTPSEYLKEKITYDGPWGIMLAQTSPQAGYQGVSGRCANELTNSGISHLELAGHYVDAMGTLEWVALTMQEDSYTSWPSMSLLLANRHIYDSREHVAFGYVNPENLQVVSNLGMPDYRSDAQPRLAVM